MFLMRKATFANFRQLRDVCIEFGSDFEKPLTIIRAENRTGKTTMLTALSWALFGDKALKNRSEYRMHPLDWDHENEGFSVDISVEYVLILIKKWMGLISLSLQIKRSSLELSIKVMSINLVSTQTVVLRKYLIRALRTLPIPMLLYRDLIVSRNLFTDDDRTLKFIDSEDSVGRRKDRVDKQLDIFSSLRY